MAPSNGQLPASALAPIADGELERLAAAAWNAMNVKARSEGLELVPTGSMSSYRTLEQQKILYARYQAGTGNLAAVPGTSNHGWGLAVDVATPAMRAMIDRIGAPFGWSKEWSDAPSEWWHIKFQAGHYSGPDPGPYGASPVIPDVPEGTMAIAVATKKSGFFEVFVQQTSGEIFHTWQDDKGHWNGAKQGTVCVWQSMGKPGAK
jgi:hypothetical protein